MSNELVGSTKLAKTNCGDVNNDRPHSGCYVKDGECSGYGKQYGEDGQITYEGKFLCGKPEEEFTRSPEYSAYLKKEEERKAKKAAEALKAKKKAKDEKKQQDRMHHHYHHCDNTCQHFMSIERRYLL